MPRAPERATGGVGGEEQFAVLQVEGMVFSGGGNRASLAGGIC